MTTAEPSESRTRIKICGISTEETALAAVEAGADYIGFVFAEGSPRRITAPRALEIAAILPEHVEPVGVFRLGDTDEPDLQGWTGAWCQLHGDETERTIGAIEGRRLIRGFSFDEGAVRRWDRCADLDLLLVDGPAAGSGASFDHRRLGDIASELDHPIVLAGGLTPENVGHAIDLVRPYAVDVSSGVESAPGVKDVALIREFCGAVRESDQATKRPSD
jgi:phosphoribosylanthranilate isomerase